MERRIVRFAERSGQGRAVGPTRSRRYRASASCQLGMATPAPRQPGVRERAVARPLGPQPGVRHPDGRQARLDVQLPGRLAGQGLPGARAGADAVIQAVRRPPLQQLHRRPRHVRAVARRHGPVDEHPRLPALQDRVQDPIDAGPPRARRRGERAEHALDAQDVVAARLAREPLAHQLRAGVGAARIRLVLLGVRPVGGAVEDEIGAVVHEHGSRRPSRGGQPLHREGVDLERLRRLVLRAIDVGVRRAVDHDVRAHTRHRRLDGELVADVEVRAHRRRHIGERRDVPHDGGPEMPGGADDQDPHLRPPGCR